MGGDIAARFVLFKSFKKYQLEQKIPIFAYRILLAHTQKNSTEEIAVGFDSKNLVFSLRVSQPYAFVYLLPGM